MAKVYDLVAVCGEYRDSTAGKNKRRYINCGAVFRNDDGSMWATLDSVPMHRDWDGKFQFFEPRSRGQSRGASGHAPAPDRSESQPAASAQSQKEFEDDIPF